MWIFCILEYLSIIVKIFWETHLLNVGNAQAMELRTWLNHFRLLSTNVRPWSISKLKVLTTLTCLLSEISFLTSLLSRPTFFKIFWNWHYFKSWVVEKPYMAAKIAQNLVFWLVALSVTQGHFTKFVGQSAISPRSFRVVLLFQINGWCGRWNLVLCVRLPDQMNFQSVSLSCMNTGPESIVVSATSVYGSVLLGWRFCFAVYPIVWSAPRPSRIRISALWCTFVCVIVLLRYPVLRTYICVQFNLSGDNSWLLSR